MPSLEEDVDAAAGAISGAGAPPKSIPFNLIKNRIPATPANVAATICGTNNRWVAVSSRTAGQSKLEYQSKWRIYVKETYVLVLSHDLFCKTGPRLDFWFSLV